MQNEPIITCTDLTFRYDTDQPALEPAVSCVNLAIRRGEFIAVLGRNGSGKSTLAKLMNGILIPTEGSVSVEGMDTADEDNLVAIRRKVGMVFQNPDNQLVSNVVEEDVAFGPENLGIPSEEIRRRVDEALQAVGMTEYAHHAPHKLSGGQKQRVAIAGILAMKPDCIILDEATAMLDPRGRREIMDTVTRLNREDGITVVLITHHMEEAVQTDRVLVMEKGAIIDDGTPKEIFSHVEELKKAGLSVPQVTELLHELSWDGEIAVKYKIPRGILTEEEAADCIMELLNRKHG